MRHKKCIDSPKILYILKWVKNIATYQYIEAGQGLFKFICIPKTVFNKTISLYTIVAREKHK